MFFQVLEQACLATRLKQVLAHLVSPRPQGLVVCLEAQQQTQQEVYLAEQVQAVSLDSNQLLNVSVAFLQIHEVTPFTRSSHTGKPQCGSKELGQMCLLQAGLLILWNLFEMFKCCL